MENIETGNHHLHSPIYNIKAVARLVGLFPVTLRAWERRYGLPSPQRGQQGYRLYSEYDVYTLRWLKSQVEGGMSIGRAVKFLHELRTSGKDPALDHHPQSDSLQISLESLQQQLIQTLENFDEIEASVVIRRAFSLYALDTVLAEIISPVLIQLGERWHRGELPVTTEHFATQFCLQVLMGMLTSAAQPSHSPVIVAAAAPGEFHQIGLLMLVILLRWRGWDVRYLGQNLSLDRIEEALIPLQPRMLLFSATRREAAENLLALPKALGRFPFPAPLVVLGGQAFSDPTLRVIYPAVYLDAPLAETIERLESLLYELPEPLKLT